MSSSSRIVIKPRKRNSDMFIASSKNLQNQTTPTILEVSENITKKPKISFDLKKPYSPLLNRLITLKNLQYEHFKARAQFYNEFFQIEWNYHSKLQELCEKRAKIINGTYQTPCSHKVPRANQLNLGYELNNPKKRLPYFWLVVLLTTPVIKNLIERRDLLILESLNDVRVRYNGDKSFTIEFHFDRNDYFSNSVLKKRYYQIATIDADDPFGYEGPEIYRAEGCTIYWKKGKNLTVSYTKDSDSDDDFASGNTRTPLSFSKRHRRIVDSFFNFFNPPQFPLEKVVVDMELERVLTIDFEIGNFLRKRVIPFATLNYLKLLKIDPNIDVDQEVELERNTEDMST